MEAGLVAGYLILLCITLLAPFLAKRRPEADVSKSTLTSVPVMVGLACATLTLVGRGGLIFPLAPLLLIPFLGRGSWTVVGAIVATCLFAPAIWWSSNFDSISIWQWPAFAAVSAFAILAVRASLSASGPSKLPTVSMGFGLPAAFGAAALIALSLGVYSAPFTNDVTALTAWHHWGAYISPVEALLAGGLPFRSFPIQYGIGPTLLIASACGSNCWSGMFQVVLVANALYCGALVVSALILTAHQNRALRFVAAVAIGCSTLLWTALPPEFGTALATPSVAGLRFLPLVSQLLFILWSERNPRVPTYYGHAIWIFNLFWSVEAAAFASLLWWPWLALRAVRHQSENRYWLVLRYAVAGVAAFTVTMLLLLAMFRLYFGTSPEFDTVIAYFQNPPGRWPANPFGPVWLVMLIAVMALGLILRGKIEQNGSLFACLVTMIVVFSYYLSRSHDNNILNLFPFLLLVSFCLLPPIHENPGTDDSFRQGFCLTFIMSVIVFVALFNFSVWENVTKDDQLAHIGPEPLINQVSPKFSDPNPIVSSDAVALLEEVRKQSDYAPLLFDQKAVMPWSPPGSAWTGVNNIANYSPLAPTLVRRYIRRGAAQYRRPGWLIVDQTRFGEWPLLFAESYEIVAVKRRGRYAAYLMNPKN